MKALCFVTLVFLMASSADAQERAFFGDPPDANNPWAIHDRNRPQPPVVNPGAEWGQAPSDATVLFDGSEASFANWTHVKADDKRKVDWRVVDGALQPQKGAGYLETLESFGDCQVHLEWAAPAEIRGEGQGRGNSGVFLMGLVEVQILDNYQNPTYADGTAGAVYGLTPPAVNALRPPEEWQSYDIIFRRPIVRDGQVLDPGSLTVLVNGVVVQDSTAINGGGTYRKRLPIDRVFPEAGPLRIQDHGDPVRFRNIWIRPLRPRPVDGGSDGRLTPEATLKKRAEIAAAIRLDTREFEGLERAYLLLESLVYEANSPALQEARAIVEHYLSTLTGLDAVALADEKDEVRELYRVFNYMTRSGFLESDDAQWVQIRDLALDQGWVRPRK